MTQRACGNPVVPRRESGLRHALIFREQRVSSGEGTTGTRSLDGHYYPLINRRRTFVSQLLHRTVRLSSDHNGQRLPKRENVAHSSHLLNSKCFEEHSSRRGGSMTGLGLVRCNLHLTPYLWTAHRMGAAVHSFKAEATFRCTMRTTTTKKA
jgi:hypothetical protein